MWKGILYKTDTLFLGRGNAASLKCTAKVRFLKQWNKGGYKANKGRKSTRVCLPIQERQELQFWSLGQKDPPGGGNGPPLQSSFLENPMDRGAWRATARRAAKSRTRRSAEHAIQSICWNKTSLSQITEVARRGKPPQRHVLGSLMTPGCLWASSYQPGSLFAGSTQDYRW